ncbi:ABC transporter permease [Paenibacillus chitinolyticus]|uniref:ABC transporter permease n=1 Tax=Paenibacillus chitinolyticus TaxID=79263 RepID=UPI0026E4BE87|nr:ABC transporter permease [Paenibacillus chitinolyticus]GKS12477.1 ABC transporter permease [Paenibacillus chitinolyticus]
MKFLSLVQNEIMKITSKKSTWIFYIFLLLLSLFVGLPIKLWIPGFSDGHNYISFAGTVFMVCSLFVTLFALVLGAQTVTEEYKDGTIKQLLIRPAGRTAILLSKYIACVIMVLIAYAVLFLSSVAVGAALFGTAKLPDEHFIVLSSSYWYSLPDMLFMFTLAFFIATVFRSSALAITVAIVMNLAGSAFAALQYNWARYLIFNNTNWKIYDPDPLINQGTPPPFPGMTFGFSLTIYVLHLVILLGVTILVFRKRDVA